MDGITELPFLAGLASLIFMAWLFNRVWTAGRRAQDMAEALAARALGLRPAAQDGTSGPAEFEGEIDGFRVTLERVALENKVRIVVDGGGKIPRLLRLGQAPRLGWAEELGAGGAHVAPRENGRAIVPDNEIPHLFTPKARSTVASAVERLGVEVSAGEVFREVKVSDNSTSLARQVRNTARLAATLARETLPACRRALREGTHWQRFEAARILEAEGRPTLGALATDDEAPEPVIIEALQALDAANDRPGMLAGLMHQVEKGKGLARFYAIETLAALLHRPAVEPLARLLDDADEATAVAAADALGAMEDARAEAALIAALGSESAEVQIAAARALAAVGTAVAVEPLLLSDRGPLRAPRFHAIAREAIARIQARLPGAEAGRLALAGPEPDAGGLSLSVEERAGEGAVSIAKTRRKPRTTA